MVGKRIAGHRVAGRVAVGLVAACTLALAGCATASQGGDTTDATPSSGSSRNVLVRADLLATSGVSVYDAISQLRPQWLRTRGGDAPTVYIDGRPAGDLGTLRSLRTQEAESVRFYSSREATTKWGTGHAGGVIDVERVR